MGSNPGIDYVALAPLIIVLLGGVLGVLLEALVPRRVRYVTQSIVTALILAASLGMTIWLWADGRQLTTGVGSIMLDGPARLSWALLLVFALASLALFAERRLGDGDSAFVPMAASVPGSPMERQAGHGHAEHTEVFPLLSFSVGGMMLFTASNDLIMLFIGLEVLSLPLYLLCGLARRRRLISQEAALKYFLLGALSSAIFIYGVALVYGYAGAFGLGEIDAAITANSGSITMLVIGMGLILVGLLFKVGAVPFHAWVPDVYTGAPTPVTAFMAVATKAAALFGLLRVLYVAFGALLWDWQVLLAIVAVATMAFGAAVGLVQRDVKRMLAYSSIAHAGFLLLGVLGAQTVGTGVVAGELGSVGAIAYYLLAYGLATIGAFGVVLLVRRTGGEATSMVAWEGLGRRNPMLAGLMTVFLLSMTGIPLTAGFLGKLFVFSAAWQGGYQWLVLVAVAFSLVTAGFYLKLVWTMFFVEPNGVTEIAEGGIGVNIVVYGCALATVLFGLAPSLVTEVFAASATFLR